MSRRFVRQLICNAYLAVLLVAAQITVVSHVDTDGHAVDSPCTICISASTLATGAVMTAAMSVLAASHDTLVDSSTLTIRPAPFVAHPARAPPVSA